MRILITGNLGYIGPCVSRHLRASFPDASLVGLDMGFFAHCLTNATSLPESQLDVQYFGDVRSPSPEALIGVDAIVHLAAISNDPMGNAYEAVTMAVNYRASVELAKLAKAAGVRSFVFASSCSVYGSAGGGPRTEQAEVNPLTAYAKSKVLTESGLAELADQDFTVTCLRFATACGMSERLRLDLVLNDFVASAISTGRITVLSDGTPWRPLINVQDMARAIEWAIGRQPAQGGAHLVVNTGSNEWNYQVSELAAAVAGVIRGTDVSINKEALPDKRSYRVDFSLFSSLAPRHVPVKGLLDTVEDLRHGLEAMRFNRPDFRDSSFMRLRVLTTLQSQGLLTPNLEWAHKAQKVNQPMATAIGAGEYSAR